MRMFKVVEAVQWWGKEDHPVVRWYQLGLPDMSDRCPLCHRTYKKHGEMVEYSGPEDEHGILRIICPGDWIIDVGRNSYKMTNEEFEKIKDQFKESDES